MTKMFGSLSEDMPNGTEQLRMTLNTLATAIRMSSVAEWRGCGRRRARNGRRRGWCRAGTECRVFPPVSVESQLLFEDGRVGLDRVRGIVVDDQPPVDVLEDGIVSPPASEIERCSEVNLRVPGM